jgi:hypothetical protein
MAPTYGLVASAATLLPRDPASRLRPFEEVDVAQEVIPVGDFGSIVSGEGTSWVPGSFPTADGGSWVYQEPNASVIVQNGGLCVSVLPFTRSHDHVQFFDNAKHMYFSSRSYGAPEGGKLTLEWEQAARIVGGRPGDLYDGFVSFHLLDLARGVAVNFFVGSDQYATVHAHLPFPGTTAPPRARGPKYFCWFEEHGGLEPGAFHAYAICYDRAAGTLSWRHQGEVVKRAENVGELGPFTIALGLMTEKDIQPGKGSVSCRGQGAVGKWRNIRAITETP